MAGDRRQSPRESSSNICHSRRRFIGCAAAVGATSVAGCTEWGSSAREDGPRLNSLEYLETARERGFDYEYVHDGSAGQQVMITNAGLYVADVTNDGSEDILAIGGSVPELYYNQGGTFERSDSFPEIDDPVLGALFFDHDNNGFDDLLLLVEHGEPITLINDGGTFTEGDLGFDFELEIPVGAAAADCTGNGLLDVFVIQNGDWSSNRPLGTEGHLVSNDNGNPNYLFRNEGGEYVVDRESGIDGDRWSLAMAFVDLTDDGNPDIYVANDFNTDILYRNRGDGTFEPQEMPDSNRNAMSATIADVTGNGLLDVFVTNIYFDNVLERHMPTIKLNSDGNNLFINEGDGSFVDRAEEYGIHKGGWGWAALVEDFTNTGIQSLIHATSQLGVDSRIQSEERLTRDEIDRRYPYINYPAVFGRVGDDAFESVHPTDLGFERMNSRGMVALDCNQNGMLDIAIANARGAYKLYECSNASDNWLRVNIQPDRHRPAIGSKLYVETETISSFKPLHSGSDFLSQESRIIHFGLGEETSATLTVAWPDETERTFDSVPSNHQIAVYPDGEYTTQYSG